MCEKDPKMEFGEKMGKTVKQLKAELTKRMGKEWEGIGKEGNKFSEGKETFRNK